ncbi:MAG: Rieske 2Fe-2S domain-containing protein [Ktedonobacterales bacterium]
MALQNAMEVLERQQWLDAASEPTQRAVSGAINAGGKPGRWLDDFLNGVWLGHPLHPMLVSIPIGAWSVTMALDAFEALNTGEAAQRYATGADAALIIGLVGAVGSAATGLTQWQYTDGQARRLGLVHATLNTAVTALYTTSLICRKMGARRAGFWMGLLGYAGVTVSGYIGGELSYTHRIGVDHAPEQLPPGDFTSVLASDDLAEGQLKGITLQSVPVCLARQHGQVYALANDCSHLGGPLAEGQLEEGCVVCPWHSSRFALADGHVLNGPAACNQPAYEVRERNGQIELRPAHQA